MEGADVKEGPAGADAEWCGDHDSDNDDDGDGGSGGVGCC